MNKSYFPIIFIALFLFVIDVSNISVKATTEKPNIFSLANNPPEIKNNDISKKDIDSNFGTPLGLMVEYIREPEHVKISDSLPEYSWIVPTEAVFQKAYQILVSSSREKIDENNGDIWNSNQVESKQSINIEHRGDPLLPNTTYYWKVRIWDQANKESDYSSPQTFKTGTFDKYISTKNQFQIEKIAPVIFKQTSSGSYFIDFGKDAFGTLVLHYDADKPESLTIRLGEKLKGESIDRQPGGSIRYQELILNVTPDQSQYELNLPPDKRNTSNNAVLLPESFGVVMPFRYCEIENALQDLSAADARQKALFHYFKNDQSHFRSSDSILDQLWDLCKYSIKATSFTGLYIDGDRERISYEGDAYINQLSHYSVDREYAMAKQTIEYFMDQPTWPTEWLLHTVMMVYQDYYYTGDTELAEAYYESLKHKTLMNLDREDGLISSSSEKVTDTYMQKLGFPDGASHIRDVIDWPPGERDGYEIVPYNTVVNSFFYHNMEIMAELAEVLNKPKDADYFHYMAAKVKKSINTKFFDDTQGIYVDGESSSHASLHANMIPLALDLVPEKHVSTVVDFVKSRGMACSVYGAQYLLEGLYKVGEEQYALDLMRAKHDRSWWNMIKVGSTITMEAWDMKYKPNSDWNHAWGAVPANIIPRYLWGIQPKEPGFRIASIYPQMGDLQNSSIVVPTMHGQIKGNYQKVNKHLSEYKIELPANMVAEFSVPNMTGDMITLNGETVNIAFDTIRLYPGVNQIEIHANLF